MAPGSNFFHLTGATLDPGSVIRPGNWGRVVQLFGWKHTSALREMALEAARLAHFPDRPSRLACAFVCLNEVEGRAYQHTNNLMGHVLHEVVLVHESMAPFVTSWGLVSPSGNLRSNWADAYWDGVSYKGVHCNGELFEGVPAREGLTLSPLRVLRAVD